MAMRSEENKKIIQNIYECFGKGDVTGILARLDDKVVWTIGQKQNDGKNLKWIRTYNGKQDVGEFFKLHGEDYEFEKFEPKDFLTSLDGDIVSTTVDTIYVNKTTKKKQEILLLHKFTFNKQSNKIIEVYSLFDVLSVIQLSQAVTHLELNTIVSDIVKLLNKRDLQSIGNMFPDEVKIHGFGPMPIDRKGWNTELTNLFQAFPDGQFKCESVVADERNSLVTFHHSFIGTQKGAYKNVPSTNKAVQVSAIAIYKVKKDSNNKLIIPEWWITIDMFGMMVQLGVISPPA